jgi:hypothetical protein
MKQVRRIGLGKGQNLQLLYNSPMGDPDLPEFNDSSHGTSFRVFADHSQDEKSSDQNQ